MIPELNLNEGKSYERQKTFTRLERKTFVLWWQMWCANVYVEEH